MNTCEHDWVDAKNEYVQKGWYCSKCRHLSADGISPIPTQMFLSSTILETIGPVAWRCKDYADGWILYSNETAANKYQEQTGCLKESLYSPAYVSTLENRVQELEEAISKVGHVGAAHEIQAARISSLEKWIAKARDLFFRTSSYHDTLWQIARNDLLKEKP